MRGKPRQPRLSPDALGITPADAGKTGDRGEYVSSVEDHPRGCGENHHTMAGRLARAGSPPRMRGKLQAIVDALPQIRITPADAGKTRQAQLPCLPLRDHPRGCGENSITGIFERTFGGSPPRMRGKHARRWVKLSGVRITPADAGKTLKRSFRNQPFCSRAVQISFNFSNSLNVSLQSGSAR